MNRLGSSRLTVAPTEEPGVIEHFDYMPVGLFGATMGLSGLSVAWRLADSRYGAPGRIADVLGLIAALTFVITTVAYLIKIFSARDAVRAEFIHPITGSLFGTIPVSLLLLPIIIAPICLRVAQALWIIGAFGMVSLGWMTVARWISNRQTFSHASPAWIVPVVGILDIPLALPSLGLFGMHDIAVGCFAVGTFFAIPLFTIIFSRLLFEVPLPSMQQPMLLILSAPFSVGFSSYVATISQIDIFAECLYSLTLFVLTILLGQLLQLRKCCPFRVAWWAVTFPLDASAITAIRFASASPRPIKDLIAISLLGLASIVALSILTRTVSGIFRGELRSLSA